MVHALGNPGTLGDGVIVTGGKSPLLTLISSQTTEHEAVSPVVFWLFFFFF